MEQVEVGPALDALIEERIFGHTGLGYYGPPEDGSPWSHEKSVRHDTPEEAEAAYRRLYESRTPAENYGKARPDEGLCSGLCYWEDGWGPLAVDDYSTEMYDALQLVEWAKSQPSDVRDRFIASIRRQLIQALGETVDPEWRIFYLTPEMICRAALDAVQASEG